MTKVLGNSQHHNKCVCQICTCHKHHCPHCDPQLPFEGDSTYNKDYHKHPINMHPKTKEKGPDLDRHYDYINSKYREDYPGHKVKMVEKIKPKNPNQLNLPFYGDTDYRMSYGPKKVELEPPYNKDRNAYQPTGPFDGTTTYKSDFPKKYVNPHPKRKEYDAQFPPGYKFNGDTTYKSDYLQKPFDKASSYKPIDRLGETGPHDLQTNYRQDYTEKELPCKCPVLDLPEYSNKIKAPYSHYGYDATRNKWYQKS